MSLSHALRRGAFHAVSGFSCVLALLLLPQFTMLAALGTVTVAFLSFELARLRVSSLNRRFATWCRFLLREEEVNNITGSSYFLASCLLTVVAFPKNVAALAILFLSLGDPVATIVGVWKGENRLWGKTLEGDVACFVVCVLAGFSVSACLQEPPLIIAIVGAVFAAIIQALPIKINDNLTIPIGSATAMLVASIIA
jgi:dolichol kinase